MLSYSCSLEGLTFWLMGSFFLSMVGPIAIPYFFHLNNLKTFMNLVRIRILIILMTLTLSLLALYSSFSAKYMKFWRASDVSHLLCVRPMLDGAVDSTETLALRVFFFPGDEAAG